MRDDEAMVLHGSVVDDRDEEITNLRSDNQRLRRELAMANGEIARAKSEAARALGAVRKQLAPFYRLLQAVFGELDAAGVEDVGGPAAPVNARTAAIWDSWKQRLGPTCAKVIDALLLQPEMTNRQIAVAIGTGRIQTIYDAVAKMNKVSLLTKNGDRYSLKQL